MMKKETLYEPKHLKMLSIMIEKKLMQKREEKRSLFRKIQKLLSN